MYNQNIDNVGNSSSTAVIGTSVIKQPAKGKPQPAKSALTGGARTSTKSKKEQLIALLSKPNGARTGVIVKRLGWQAHTVRSAMSGLRKQGVEIVRSTSAKTGKSVYSIVTSSSVNEQRTGIDADVKQTGGEA